MAHRIRRQLSVIVFLALAGAIGGASAGHAQTLPPSCTGFTDDPLQAGVTVKAQHVTELRACVDALRVQAGLAAVTWTDLTLQAGATWIRAVHIIELRTALGAVYAAHGETEPAYTDPALTAVATLVRAAHITEIRTAILVVAGVCEPETCSNDGPIDQAIEYYHLDALGSVRAVTDEVGDVVRRHDYFPFGEGVSAIDGYVQRYAEQEGDPESGLSYVGARYYRAWTGRFTTVDPGHVGGDLFNPQSWNGYAYAHNNPATLADPTGLDPTFRVTIVGKLPRTRSGSEEDSFFWWVFSHLFDSSAMGDHSVGGGNRGGGGGRREPPPPTEDPPPGTTPPPPDPSGPPSGTPGGSQAGEQATRGAAVVSVNGTTNSPTIAAGAFVGGAVGGPFGCLLGAIGGSFFGVGLNFSVVPSTGTLYIGPTFVAAPALGGGSGVAGNVVYVPSSQNPNSIARGLAFSATFQPMPFHGSTVVKSPGNGPSVVGWSVGTRLPVYFSGGYNFLVH